MKVRTASVGHLRRTTSASVSVEKLSTQKWRQRSFAYEMEADVDLGTLQGSQLGEAPRGKRWVSS
jgi:hypothetical protein